MHLTLHGLFFIVAVFASEITLYFTRVFYCKYLQTSVYLWDLLTPSPLFFYANDFLFVRKLYLDGLFKNYKILSEKKNTLDPSTSC